MPTIVFSWEDGSMSRVIRVILILLGIGAIAFIVLQRQADARRVWDEILEQVPSPDDCCECCDADDKCDTDDCCEGCTDTADHPHMVEVN